MSKSEYIAFQDSDDEWLPEKLAKQVSCLDRTKRETGAAYVMMWRKINNKMYLFPPAAIGRKDQKIDEMALEMKGPASQALLVRKHCLERVGLFDEKLTICEDNELLIRLSQHYSFAIINEPLVMYDPQADSITTTMSLLDYIRSWAMIIEKHHEKYLKNRNSLRKLYHLLGHYLCQIGQMERGRNWLLKSFKLNPVDIRVMSKIAASLLGHDAYMGTLMLKKGFKTS